MPMVLQTGSTSNSIKRILLQYWISFTSFQLIISNTRDMMIYDQDTGFKYLRGCMDSWNTKFVDGRACVVLLYEIRNVI